MGAPLNNEEPFAPAIAGFFCPKCGEDCLSRSGITNGEYPDCLKSVRLICAEQVGPDLIRQAFGYGADGVLICGCLIGQCDTMDTNAQVLDHIHRSKMAVKDLGLHQGRLRQDWVCGQGVDSLEDIVAEFAASLRQLGPARPGASEVRAEQA